MTLNFNQIESNREKVVIIIPTYNEALVIEQTIKQVFSATSHLDDFDIELLIFDSASTDKTAEKVKRLISHYQNKLHLQTEDLKTGLGSAYLQAMRFALNQLHADIVIEFDADLSHQPKYISSLLHAIKQNDVAVGSRYIPGGSIPNNWGWHRKLLSVLGNLIARMILTFKYHDFTSGFRATRRDVLMKVLPENFLSTQYAYKLHLLWLLHKNKAKIVEVPIEFIDRTLGSSKLPANSIKDSLWVILNLRYQEIKYYIRMCLVGLSGAAIQLLFYNLLRLHCPPVYAIKISTLAAIINNFVLNHKFTFRHARNTSGNMSLRFAIFLAYFSLIIQIQSYGLEFGMRYVGSGRFIESLILIVIIGLSSIANYFFSSRVIWRVQKNS